LVLRQWVRLRADEREWLSDLVHEAASTAWLTSADAAQLWQVARSVAERRLWLLEHSGLVEAERAGRAQVPQWRVAPIAYLVLASLVSR
jgi:hypothetical protein